MSYASYEQEHRDQEVFQKLVQAYKANEEMKTSQPPLAETKNPVVIPVIDLRHNK